MSELTEKTPVNPSRPRWRVLLWPPILWLAYFLVVYLVNEASCQLDFWQRTLWGDVTVYNLLALLVSLVVLLGLGYWGYRGWQLMEKETEPPPGVTVQATAQRDRLMGLSTLIHLMPKKHKHRVEHHGNQKVIPNVRFNLLLAAFFLLYFFACQIPSEQGGIPG